MSPPLYTLFCISPLFSRDILGMTRCVMHTQQGTRVFFVWTVRVLVLHTKLSGLTGIGIKQDNRAVVLVPPLSHSMHTMLLPRQVGGLLIRHLIHTSFLWLVGR